MQLWDQIQPQSHLMTSVMTFHSWLSSTYTDFHVQKNRTKSFTIISQQTSVFYHTCTYIKNTENDAGNVLPKIFQISLKRFRMVFIYICLSLLNVERWNVKDGVKGKRYTKNGTAAAKPFLYIFSHFCYSKWVKHACHNLAVQTSLFSTFFFLNFYYYFYRKARFWLVDNIYMKQSLGNLWFSLTKKTWVTTFLIIMQFALLSLRHFAIHHTLPSLQFSLMNEIKNVRRQPS